MKKLISNFTGGAPFSLDYLGFVDAKINEIVKGFGSFSPLCIISGCQLTQGVSTWQLSEGYVYIIGEIYYVPAADTALPNADDPQAGLYWNINEAAVAPSPNVYHDAVSHNDTLEDTAYLSTVASLFTYASTLTYQQRVANSLLGAWHTVGAGGEPAFQNGYTNNLGNAVRFRRDLMGRVSLSGSIGNNAAYVAGTETILFTLPLSYRPAYNWNYTVQYAANLFGVITIYANGNVTFTGQTDSAGGVSCFLSCASFYQD